MRVLESTNRRLRSLPPWIVDSLLALALAVPTASSALGDRETLREPWWLVGPLVALTVLPLAARRSWPAQTFLVMLASALVLELGWNTFPVAGALVGLYTVATRCGRRLAIATAAVAAAGIAIALVGEPASNLALGVALYAGFAAAWILGDNLRVRRAYLAELEERAGRLEREREENARRAVADEQARIARELHDVIAHNVSVMVVQAAAAGDVFESQPRRAREALASIEATGRDALAELRRLLGAVQTAGLPTELAPQPGLDGLAALADHVRAAGMRVDVEVEGEPVELPAGMDLAAYRIVQEALTNTLKHAQATQAFVVVRYRRDELEVEVRDDGGGSAGTDGGGRGIVGMRERVALYGGELSVGNGETGGFRVNARLPLETA